MAATSKALTAAKPKLLKLTNQAGSEELAESKLKWTQTDAGITISATLPAEFAKADTTGQLTVCTASGGDSDPLNVTFSMAPVLDQPAASKVTLDGESQALLKLTGRYLTKATATIDLKSPTNSKATVAAGDIKVSDPTDTGLTITAMIPADYAKAGVTATITVKTSAGKSNSVVFTLQSKQ